MFLAEERGRGMIEAIKYRRDSSLTPNLLKAATLKYYLSFCENQSHLNVRQHNIGSIFIQIHL